MRAIDVLGSRAARTVFDAARALAWADGELVEPEIRALRGLAVALGLADVLAGRDDLLSEPVAIPLGHRLAGLDARARLVLVATAAWVAIADGRVTPTELRALDELADRCALEADTARFARAHAAWATRAAEGEAPHRIADRLIVEGARRTASLEAMRAAA